MKKIISLILSIAMLSITLTACGSTDSSDKNDTELGQSGEQSQIGESTDTLVIFDTSGYELSGQVVDRFSKLYPNVKVEVIYSGSMDEREAYNEKMMVEIMSGRGPDIIYMKNYFFTEDRDAEKMIRAGAFADMNTFIKNDKDFDYSDYNEGAMKLGVFDGGRYIMPTAYDIPMMLTTQKLLDKTGFNIDNCTDFWKFSEEAKKYAETYKSGMPGLSMYGMHIFKDFRSVAGINVMDYDGQKTTLDSSEFKRSAEDMQKLFMKFPWENEEWSGKPVQYLVDQQYLFMPQLAWSFGGVLESYLEVSEAGETPVLFPIKDINGKIQGAYMNGLAITNNSKNKQNAYNFTKFMLSLDEQAYANPIDLTIPKGCVPVLKEAIDMAYTHIYSVEREMPYITDNGTNVVRKPLPKEVFDKYKGYLDEVANVSFNSGAQSKLNEIMQEYYTGKVDYNTCIDKAKKTLDIYISE